MIQFFKIMKGIDDVDPETLFTFNRGATRGNDMKLHVKYNCTNLRHHFFTNRIVPQWNSLPNDVIQAKDINGFKNLLDKHFIHEKFDYD